MTMPEVPLTDSGNSLLAQAPAQMHTGFITTPAGKLGVLTFRTASTTMTIFLGEADLRGWSGALKAMADQIGGGLVPASPLDIAAVSAPAALRRRR